MSQSEGNSATYGDFGATPVRTMVVAPAVNGSGSQPDRPIHATPATSISPPPSVSLLDAYGQVVRSSTATVEAVAPLSVENTLQGSSLRRAVAGVATFPSLTVHGAAGELLCSMCLLRIR